MKKFAFAVAAASLMSLAACDTQTGGDNQTATENLADNMSMESENLSDAADNATTDTQEDALDNASDNMAAAAENVGEMAENEAEAK